MLLNQFESQMSRFVPSLQEILYRLVGAATDESLRQPSSTNPGRFPVVVRPETRAFLEAQANYLGGSIAGVAGAILDGVAMSTQRRDGGEAALRGISERFNILIQEHELSFPAAAEALADLGITLADLSAVERLLLKLSSPVLRSVAERFYVRYEWLAGKDDYVIQPTLNSWYKSPTLAANKLLEARRNSRQVELTLYIKTGSDLSMTDDDQEMRRLPHFIPVIKRSTDLPGGEKFETYELWDEGRWSYWRCRYDIKLSIYFAHRLDILVTGKQLSPTDYDLLTNGGALPATIFRRNQQGNRWHPTDYVTPDSYTAKAPDEWANIVKDSGYASAIKDFEKLLQENGVSK